MRSPYFSILVPFVFAQPSECDVAGRIVPARPDPIFASKKKCGLVGRLTVAIELDEDRSGATVVVPESAMPISQLAPALELDLAATLPKYIGLAEGVVCVPVRRANNFARY